MMASRFFARSMASAAKSVKPPVQLFGVDGTYANALYSASVQESSVEASYQGLSKVAQLIKEDTKVNEFLTNPALSKDDRKTVIDTLSSSLKLDKTVTNFLSVLSENNRLGEFSSIYKNFGLLFDAHRGVVEATITSAKPLDSKILKRLQTAIQKSSFVGSDKTLKISNKVNPDILGGLVVDVGDKTVDLSIVSKVSKLNSALGEAL
ncbi:ATP synthase subunit 5, mitochondrial [Clavispora lusitaniae]|uniref:ATP synthase subunit 5, mitochondrial n=1 Tax=Clavispora lusitaniae TaxID=36911 RepID=UPI00169CFC15|nr:ATP synthase F0 subcomplex subunit OSCP atp5 [Clavispora lusitaniae]KAF7584497.1 ATP synthase subunit 5, mitochondrial [Clavispora lusitaniae]